MMHTSNKSAPDSQNSRPMATPSDDFTGDDFEAADALLLIKVTDPEELLQCRATGGRFFPRWLAGRRRSVPKDDAASLSPATPLSISSTGGDQTPSPPSSTTPIGGGRTASPPLPSPQPTSPIGSYRTPSRPLPMPPKSIFSILPPPMTMLPPQPPLPPPRRPKTRKTDEKFNQMAKEKKQMIKALSETKLNLQHSLAEAHTRYRTMMEANYLLRDCQSKWRQAMVRQLYGGGGGHQTLDLFPVGPNFSLGPTFPVGPEANRTVAAAPGTEWLRQRMQEQLRATEQAEARKRRMELQKSRPWANKTQRLR